MMRFISACEQNTLEIHLVEAATLPQAAGDTRLRVTVSSHGFGGFADAWVDRNEMASFKSGLVQLNESLSGHASIKSMSPGELDFTVQSVSPLGRLSVSGSLRKLVRGTDKTYWHAVSFGFEFEPSQLQAAVGTLWVSGP
jgi:hypothetical protein